MGPHLSLLKYQTPLSPFLFTFLSAVLLNSQPLTFISKISAIHLLHSTPFLKSPVNHQCKKEKKKTTYFFLYSLKSLSSACTSQRCSHLLSSVLSAHSRNLSSLNKLQISITNCSCACCSLALKLKLPAQGHGSCCTFRLLSLE